MFGLTKILKVEVQSQNYSIKNVSKNKADTCSIKTIEFSVSPILHVNVSCVNLDDILNFIKSLEYLSKFIDDSKKFSLIDFRCCEEKGCANLTWQSWNYRESDVGAQYFLGMENYFHVINAPLKLFFNNLREYFLGNFKRDDIQFDLIVKLSNYFVGWYGIYQFLSLNPGTSFFEKRVNDVALVKIILIYYLYNYFFKGNIFLILDIRILVMFR